jgi:hypothetical protein
MRGDEKQGFAELSLAFRFFWRHGNRNIDQSG